MAPGGRRRKGRRGHRGGGGSMFVDGGWLSDWKPAGNKRRFVKPLEAIPIPDSTQLILPAHPGCAAVFEDKQPMRPDNSRSKLKKLEEDEDDDEDDETEEDEGFSSSIDSELADDYAENLSDDDELTCTMVCEEYSSGDEEDHDELFPEDSDSDEEESEDEDGDALLLPGFLEDDASECSSGEADLLLETGSVKQTVALALRTEPVEPSFVLYAGRDLKKKKTKKASDKPRRIPGEKKHLRQEKIAAKRRERALNRGLDLDRLNLMFEGMVIKNSDMLSLRPMKNKDLSLVSKLAAVYRLKMSCQGSGKKRFAVVTRTRHTCLPQKGDTDHLVKLLGKDPVKRTPRHRREVVEKKSRGGRSSSSSIKKKEGVNFVSSGAVFTEQQIRELAGGSPEAVGSSSEKMSSGGVEIGKFEAHTKGFGSRMLAKMGFVEGSGLGKDGQGMKQALVPQRRPKSLGLGAD